MSKGRNGPYLRTLLAVFVQSLSPYPFGTAPLTKFPKVSFPKIYFCNKSLLRELHWRIQPRLSGLAALSTYPSGGSHETARRAHV